MKIDDKNQTLLVVCGFGCSQNCIFCSVAGQRKNAPKTTAELMKTIKTGRQNGFKTIEFSGGEPTIRKDIFALVDFAKKTGYKDIGVISNGRMFAYEDFCRRMIESGLTYAIISLHGRDKKTQERISRAAGSFSQTTKGIKNLTAAKLPVAVSTAVNKFNYQGLPKFGDFIAKLGVRWWMLCDLVAEGNAGGNYAALAVPYPKLFLEFKKLAKTAVKFKRIHFRAFPLCVLPPDFFENEKISVVDLKSMKERAKQTGYKPRRITFSRRGGRFRDKYRAFPGKICDGCRFSAVCGGIPKDYMKIYGLKEFEILKNYL